MLKKNQKLKKVVMETIYIYIYIYILESSPEVQSILIPIPDLICPLEDDPNLMIIMDIYNL